MQRGTVNFEIKHIVNQATSIYKISKQSILKTLNSFPFEFYPKNLGIFVKESMNRRFTG